MTTIIRMDYFTDPYCAWSWAFQPTLEALLASESSAVEVHYHELPLVADLATSGKSALDIAAAWEKIGRVTGMPIDTGAWLEEPPDSTLPACRAAKAAARQGMGAEGRYLQALRPFLMTRQRQADQETLLEAAREANLDVIAFLHELEVPRALDRALEADAELARQYAVQSTPCVVLQNEYGGKVVIEGSRDLELLKRAIKVLRVEEETLRLEEESQVRISPLRISKRRARRS